MLTIPSLYKRLRFLADSTPLEVKKLKTCYGTTYFDKGIATIVISPICYKTGDALSIESKVSTYLHELIHVAFPAELAFWGVFEEPIIKEILEKTMYEYTCAKPSRLRWWAKRLES